MMNYIFYAPAHAGLAKTVSKKLRVRLGRAEISRFPDGEISVRLKNDVAGKNILVVGATFPPAENILELLLLVHALKSNGAKRVSVFMPYLAYARADRIVPGETFASKLLAGLITAGGADKIFVLDAHSARVKKLFKIPFTDIPAREILGKAVKTAKLKNFVVVSPDKGGVSRAENFARQFGPGEIIAVSKSRSKSGEVTATGIKGDPAGKNAIIVDDMISTGKTIEEAVRILKKNGAKDIYVTATHLLRSSSGLKRLNKNKFIKKIFVTDSIPGNKLPPKFKTAGIGTLSARAIKKNA